VRCRDAEAFHAEKADRVLAVRQKQAVQTDALRITPQARSFTEAWTIFSRLLSSRARFSLKKGLK
jgi:hypothetical protein